MTPEEVMVGNIETSVTVLQRGTAKRACNKLRVVSDAVLDDMLDLHASYTIVNPVLQGIPAQNSNWQPP